MENKTEFVSLFQEFISSYPYTPDGLRQIASYEKQRRQRRRNFEAICVAVESGEDLTVPILYQLFPDRDLVFDWSSNEPELSASVTLQLPASLDSYSKLVLTSKENPLQVFAREIVEQIGQDILNFINRCLKNSNQLQVSCKKFSEQQYSYKFPTELLTSILNALRPDEFLFINNQSRQVINYFSHKSYHQNLSDYPDANLTGHKLIKQLAQEMHQPGVPALRDDDLFDMFCQWLIDVKKYDFPEQKSPPMDEVVEWATEVKNWELQPDYTLGQCAEDTGFSEAQLIRWVRAIERKKQAVFYGSPGTGKTFVVEKLAQHLIGGSDGFSELVQFHPAYSYEDFIQGIRPQSQDGVLNYPLVPGRFLEFCKQAESRQGLCILIIDEINRANLAQVFGELMYLLEYRDNKIPLAGSSELFRIPKNVRLIGTMNTSDRSIALVDHALRRRFAFIELCPNYDVLRRYHQKKTGFQVDGLIETLKRLNNAIADKHYELGISFFLTEKLTEDIEDIWQMEIEPYLEEYFFDQPDKVNEFRWEKVKSQISL